MESTWCVKNVTHIYILINYFVFPDGLLYQFDKETSQLTDKRFEFNLYPEHSKNQNHYEALGDVSTVRGIFCPHSNDISIVDNHRLRL